MVREKKDFPIPKIPWETQVEVTYASDLSMTLKNGTLEASVDWDGTWWCSHDSSKEIADQMTLDKAMTIQIQADWEEGGRHEGFFEFCRKWLKGTLVPVDKKMGPKDWDPRSSKSKEMRRFGRVFGPDQGGLGSENTHNLDSTYFWGDTFEYTHFLTEDREEGAIIRWHGSAPEVWMGGFGEFMSTQDEGDPKSPETFLYWNDAFDGTLLWAFDELGLFEGRVHMVTKFGGGQEPVSHEPPEQIVRAFAMARRSDPAHYREQLHLYPSLIEKILVHQDILPKDIVLTAGMEYDLARRLWEEAQGQKRFWEAP